MQRGTLVQMPVLWASGDCTKTLDQSHPAETCLFADSPVLLRWLGSNSSTIKYTCLNFESFSFIPPWRRLSHREKHMAIR